MEIKVLSFYHRLAFENFNCFQNPRVRVTKPLVLQGEGLEVVALLGVDHQPAQHDLEGEPDVQDLLEPQPVVWHRYHVGQVGPGDRVGTCGVGGADLVVVELGDDAGAQQGQQG